MRMAEVAMASVGTDSGCQTEHSETVSIDSCAAAGDSEAAAAADAVDTDAVVGNSEAFDCPGDLFVLPVQEDSAAERMDYSA